MTDAQLYAHAKTVIPGGTGLLSKRPEMFAPEVFPAYFKAAEKCRITTVDGRGLMTRWNGMTVKEGATARVDGVTRATYSSNAIKAEVKAILESAK